MGNALVVTCTHLQRGQLGHGSCCRSNWCFQVVLARPRPSKSHESDLPQIALRWPLEAKINLYWGVAMLRVG